MNGQRPRSTPSSKFGSRLGSRTDTRDGKTDVNGGTDTTEEELSLQEDLTVGDGNDLYEPNDQILSFPTRE